MDIKNILKKKQLTKKLIIETEPTEHFEILVFE
jgi:hypothetical protein